MANLITLTEAKAFASLTTTDVARDAALQAMIEEASDAVVRYCHNGSLTSAAYSVILPAPAYPTLVLSHFPVLISSVQIWLNWQANGDPSLFTTPFLLTPYTDYTIDASPDDATLSESALVRSLRWYWGYQAYRPLNKLAAQVTPIAGAIKATYTAGYTTIPASIKMAVNLIVRKLFNMRRNGLPFSGEALNSYSYSLQSNLNAEGIIQGDPTIRSALHPFCRPQVGSYF